MMGLGNTYDSAAKYYHITFSENTKCGVACNSLTQSRVRVFPIFAKEVFLEVLTELNIETHQSSFEADEVIHGVKGEDLYF